MPFFAKVPNEVLCTYSALRGVVKDGPTRMGAARIKNEFKGVRHSSQDYFYFWFSRSFFSISRLQYCVRMLALLAVPRGPRQRRLGGKFAVLIGI